jgi:hypothetical protein
MRYGQEKENLFANEFKELVTKYSLQIKQETESSFLDQWYVKPVRDEIDFVFKYIHELPDVNTKKLLAVILSRTMRSCRATTHADLATLLDPILSPYYCRKHGKICKPLFSILGWWERYSKDTLTRFSQFNKLRTPTFQYCFTGDSRSLDLFTELKQKGKPALEFILNNRINGIFSSPPYVGLIDYHEQHAYAYDLFGFDRRDDQEIGPLYKGQGKEARESYANGIADVLINCRKFLVKDFNIFLVANDKFGLYPKIAEKANMRIVKEFKRPVLNRTEKNKTPYSETIFHIKAR